MREAIRWCRHNQGLHVAINTARPAQEDMLWGIPPEVRAEVETAPVYHWTENGTDVKEQKRMHMERIAARLGVPVGRTVLVDDRRSTCRHLLSHGIPCVTVEGGNGMTAATVHRLRDVVRRFHI